MIKNIILKINHKQLAAVFCLLLYISFSADAQMANGKPKFAGNIIGTYVPASFDTYWNQVTPENSGKWGSVEAARNVMNWTDLDKAYNFAQLKGFTFKQHTFVWGSQEPLWVAALTPAEQAAEVEQWISLFAARYPNTQLIDVVNEPLHVIPSYVNAIGGSGTTGWDWVIWSFQKARQYCPNAKLLINDYSILSSSKNTSDYVKIINLLKARGLIDGIGVQSHGLEFTQSSTITRNLNTLQATGLPIYVSELDLESADDATQLGMYQRVFPLLYEHPGVTAVTLWGYIAGEHWKPNAYLLGSFNTLGSYTMTTGFQDYTVSGSGKVRVYFTNGNVNNAYDLEVDYAIIDGVTYQAENMPVNTGVWTGTCGGSNSQMLNCSGYIEFPVAASSITVRARGIIGGENMTINTASGTTERPALQWLRYTYFGNGTGGGTGVIAEAEGGLLGGTTIATARAGYSSTGYVTGFDAAGDFVEVNVNLAAAGTYPLIIHYASNVSISRSVKVNGSVVKKNLSFPASATFTDIQFNTAFNAGNNTVRVYMERGGTAGGDIDYIKVSGAGAAVARNSAGSVSLRQTESLVSKLNIYPNPSANGNFVINDNSILSYKKVTVQINDLLGRQVYKNNFTTQPPLNIKSNLLPGVYTVKVYRDSKVISVNKLVVNK